MKTVEALLSMPILAAFAAGANIVTETDSATSVSTVGIDGISSAAPAIALGAIVFLLMSGLYVLAREMRLEAIDQRDRREIQSGARSERSAFGKMT